MSTELSNGVIIPEEYSDDWYDEMSINLRKLNDVITAASDNATDIQRLDTDKANQSDLTALTSRVSQNETDIIALQTAVSGALKREIVQTLPTEDISTTTIYMIRNSQSSGTNIYDEYMYINSQWELIGTSATDFGNYYTKNETDNLLSGKVDNSTLGSYYTKTESDNLLSAKANQSDLTALGGRVTQTETDITALQTAVSGALKREIVQSLPTQDISTTTIYMIRNTTTSGDNIYDEYMYINNLWELIGTSATDFSNYYTKTEIDTLLSGKADDNSVVHRSGNETVGGQKTFSDNLSIYNSDNSVDTPVLNIKTSKYVRGDTTNTDTMRINFRDSNGNNVASVYTSKNIGGSQYLSFQIYTTDNNNANITSTINYYISKSGDKYFVPYEDNQISLGGSIRRWKSLYATNYYYGADKVEFSTKFVTTDTAQTITGAKTFTDNNMIKTASPKVLLINTSQTGNTAPSSNTASFLRFDGGTVTNFGGLQCEFLTTGENRLTNYVNDITKAKLNTIQQRASSTTAMTIFNADLLAPANDGVTELGSSSKRWKNVNTYLVNGLTPSSLGMPSDRSARVDISGYFTNMASGDTNTYTAPSNGWIYLALNDVSAVNLASQTSGGLTNYGDYRSRSSNGAILCLFPIRSGDVFVAQWYTTTTVTVTNAYFIPCQGNI